MGHFWDTVYSVMTYCHSTFTSVLMDSYCERSYRKQWYKCKTDTTL